VCLAALFAALGAWSLTARSAIPLSVDGTVTNIEVREEKHPGVDDVWMVSIDGKDRHLDAALASDLQVGDTVTKERWETGLSVNGTTRDLDLSGDARAMLGLAPVMVLVAIVLTVPSHRFTRRPRENRISGQRR
jgi:hypothetical protein